MHLRTKKDRNISFRPIFQTIYYQPKHILILTNEQTFN